MGKIIIQYKTYFCEECKKSIRFKFIKDVKTGWIMEIHKVKTNQNYKKK